jgi:hypothetical protein
MDYYLYYLFGRSKLDRSVSLHFFYLTNKYSLNYFDYCVYEAEFKEKSIV